jgi:hypothetical protein
MSIQNQKTKQIIKIHNQQQVLYKTNSKKNINKNHDNSDNSPAQTAPAPAAVHQQRLDQVACRNHSLLHEQLPVITQLSFGI